MSPALVFVWGIYVLIAAGDQVAQEQTSGAAMHHVDGKHFNVVADYRPFQAAKLVPAGSDITLNLHYTPNGTAVTDHVQVGFTVAKEPPQRRYVSLSSSAPLDPKLFAVVQRALSNRLETFRTQLTVYSHAELSRQSAHRALQLRGQISVGGHQFQPAVNTWHGAYGNKPASRATRDAVEYGSAWRRDCSRASA